MEIAVLASTVLHFEIGHRTEWKVQGSVPGVLLEGTGHLQRV